MPSKCSEDMNGDLAKPPYLLITVAGSPTATVELKENTSLFAGSGSNCKIVLSGDCVKPIHCVIWLDEKGTLRVQDWNTDGLTSLSGNPFTGESVWKSGEELRIDNHLIVPVLEQTDQSCQAPIEKDPVLEMQDEQEKQALVGSLKEPVVTPVIAENSSRPDEQIPSQYAYDVDAYPAGNDNSEFAMPSFEESSSPLEEEVELLRMEVEQLRYEIAERDARLQTFSQQTEENEVLEEDDQTARLVERLEDLLEELQTSDDRARGLEELLRVSDEATRAEQAERSQLESWVGEIEQRLSQREAESEAEMSRVLVRLQESQSRNKLVDAQLEQAMKPSGLDSQDTSGELFQTLREQIGDLTQRLETAQEENERLNERNQCEVTSDKGQADVQQLEQKLLELQVETSRERAETARQRAELERLKEELEQKMNASGELDEADSRIQAMRQHLQDIHEQECAERKQRSLGGRISSLLNRVGR